MQTTSKEYYALFQTDGLFSFERLKITESFDETIEGAEQLAKNQVEKRVNILKEKAIGIEFINGHYDTASFYLFGNRVCFKAGYNKELYIDGIRITSPALNENSNVLDIHLIFIGFLNIISKLGVDAFLENHKKETLQLVDKTTIDLNNLEELYKIEGTIEKNASNLAQKRKSLIEFRNYASILSIWMMPGIENETVCNAYDKLQVFLSTI